MYFKLSLKNVRKSFKDYTLYFLTLTFGVCIFYVFNSIEAQKAMMSISESTNQMMQTLTDLMGMVSVFVSVILGFLIVYANNFLVRRRKKEIGIYMTLGMEKGKVARLLIAENFLMGMLSLCVGLLAGVFLSQGLSVITAKLFEVDMTGYRFVFSSGAFLKTIVYFGIIFVIVMAMSTILVSKYKLIDLINAERQNERQRLKNPTITVVLFMLSIAFLGTAYAMVIKNGIASFDKRLLAEVILGSLGTFLFFASLSGFFLKVLQANRRIYLKGLNMFILRQINSRINTAHISMSFICLMLFWTIGILSTGLGLNNAINASYKFTAPYDASIQIEGVESVEGKLREYGFNIYNYTDRAVEISLYQRVDLVKERIFEKIQGQITENARSFYSKVPLYLLKLSDYNRLMELQGREAIILSDNQVAIYSDYAEPVPELKKALNSFVDMKYPVSISGKNYSVFQKVQTDGIVTHPASAIVLALVVPDKVIEGSTVGKTILSFNCKGDSRSMQHKLEADLFELGNKTSESKELVKMTAATKETVKSIAAGSRALIAFVGIYLGIIFLITSAAILALQQLSETADNRHRYDILQKVGADSSLINSALFKQIAIYFMLPLALACVHSVIGIKVANDEISESGGINALGNIIITAILITLIYGSYFLATYFSSRRIILRNRA